MVTEQRHEPAERQVDGTAVRCVGEHPDLQTLELQAPNEVYRAALVELGSSDLGDAEVRVRASALLGP